ncbi:hypothetical protein [Actinomadura rugatobispora]|uniref:Lactococcin 972 family bacteriocin n=1 Tax=Actinomadura rugatobispora TaxID=1994 RepID=A0ABW0ZZZ5_9ACTN|nr:hypothetical protein GCM10010200_010870 [Actinomadura rugatobispora]
MNNVQRVAIVGFAAAGMAMFGSAAMADTWHSREFETATPKGAASFGLVSAAGHGHEGKDGGKEGNHRHGKAFFKKWGTIADKHGATSFKVGSFAD